MTKENISNQLSLNYLSSTINKTVINNTLEEGIEKIWKEDEELQTTFITAIVEGIRKVQGEDATKLIQYLKKLGAFYVPNDEYLEHFFGEQIKRNEFGLYMGDLCRVYKTLAIPLRYLDGKLIGFVAYTNGNDEDDPNAVIKYLYPPKNVWDKSRYMFIEKEEFIKAVEDGYVFIVDGIFDKIILQMHGYNAVSLCGSSLTEWHEIYLKLIKHKIVAPDNDQAGTKMSRWCQRRLSNCIEFKQGDEWDIDDWLKTEKGKESFKRLFNESKAEGFLLSKVSRKFKGKEKEGQTYGN